MKVYVFYLKDGNYKFKSLQYIAEAIIERSGLILYAYTYRKSDAKVFREERDMSKFIEKKYDLNENDLDDFVSSYADSELNYEEFETNCLNRDVLMTHFEKDLVNLCVPELIYDIIVDKNKVLSESKINQMNSEIIDAFNTLGFQKINEIIDNTESFGEVIDEYNEGFSGHYNDGWDGVGLFTYFFKDLLSDNFYKDYYG